MTRVVEFATNARFIFDGKIIRMEHLVTVGGVSTWENPSSNVSSAFIAAYLLGKEDATKETEVR